MLERPLRILHLEDDDADAELIRRMLGEENIACTITRVMGRDEFLLCLKTEPFDLILSDYRLPQYDGRSALKDTRALFPDIPFIIVSGTLGEERAIEALQLGATDYVLKQRLSRLVPVVQRVLSEVEEKKERKRAEEAIRESEERFTAFMNNSPAVAWMKDPATWTFSYVNNAFEKVFDITREAISKKTDFDLWPEEVARQLRENDLKVMSSGKTIQTYEDVPLSDGTVHHWLVLKFPLNAPSGKLFLAGTAIDITERKRAEESLLKLRKAIETSGEAIFLTDREGIFTFINPGFTLLYGYGADEVVGKVTPRILKSGLLGADVYELFWKTLLRGQEARGEYKNKRKDGTLIDVDGSATAILDEEKNIVGFLGIQRDITERKRAADELKNSEKRFRSVWENSIDGMRITDKEGTIVAVNGAYCDLVGIRKEELEGKSFVVAYGLSDKEGQRVTQHYKERFSTRTILPTMEATLELRSGDLPSVEMSNAFLEREGGEPLLLSIFRDITPRKRAEEALRFSEEKYRSLVDNMQDGIFLIQDAKMQFVNEAFAKMLGYTAEEITGMNFQRLVAPEDAELVGDRYRRRQAGEDVPKEYEFRMLRKDGKTRVIVNMNVGLVTYRGKVASMGTVKDITESRQAAEALKASEEKYRTLIESMNEGVLVVDNDDVIQFVNDQFCKMVEYPREELLGKVGYKLLMEEHSQKLIKEKNRRRMEGISEQYDVDILKKSGQSVWAHVSAVPLAAPSGKVIGSMAIMTDTTERRSLEQQLAQAQKLESIGTLASGIAHDFNNILGIILGYATLIESITGDPQKLSQSVQAINGAVQRGANLVRQILTFARKGEVVFGPIDVNVMTKEISKLLRETFPRKIEISLQLGKAIPLIQADATQLHQALLNLSVNARDAMPSGGTLTFKTEIVKGLTLRNIFLDASDRDYARITVIDTGIGMDETTRSKIFDPFFTTKEKGTGLGLSVVYGVMKNHNGFVNVESERGKGSTFNLCFPIPPESVQAEDKQIRKQEEIRGGNETLLVVEDEEALLAMAKVVLEASGYRILTAQDGLEALEVYQKHRDEIALVLTDIGLPKLGGDQLFFELKKLNPAVRVILASGYIEAQAKSEILKAGVRDFVQKPYDAVELLKKVRETIDGTQNV